MFHYFGKLLCCDEVISLGIWGSSFVSPHESDPPWNASRVGLDRGFNLAINPSEIFENNHHMSPTWLQNAIFCAHFMYHSTYKDVTQSRLLLFETFATLMWHLWRFSLLSVTVKVLMDRCLPTAMGRAGLMYEWMQFGGSLKAVVVTTASYFLLHGDKLCKVSFCLYSLCMMRCSLPPCFEVSFIMEIIKLTQQLSIRELASRRATASCIRRVEDRWPWLQKTHWESLQDELARKQSVKWGHLRKTIEAFLSPPCIPVRDSPTTSEPSQCRCVVAWKWAGWCSCTDKISEKREARGQSKTWFYLNTNQQVFVCPANMRNHITYLALALLKLRTLHRFLIS